MLDEWAVSFMLHLIADFSGGSSFDSRLPKSCGQQWPKDQDSCKDLGLTLWASRGVCGASCSWSIQRNHEAIT
jgi:hypothetical protein